MNRYFWMASVFCGALAATTAAGQPRSLSCAYVSEYVSPHGLLLHDGPVLQSDLKFSFPRGFTAGVWWSAGLNGEGLSSDKADELDPYADYTRKWGKAREWQLQSRLAYFNFTELGETRGDLLVGSSELSRAFKIGNHTLAPFARYEQRRRLPALDFTRHMPVVGLGHQWSVGPRLRLTSRMGLLYDSGVPTSDEGWLLQYRVGLSRQVTKHLALEPYLRLSLPLEHFEDGRERQVIVGLGLAFR